LFTSIDYDKIAVKKSVAIFHSRGGILMRKFGINLRGRIKKFNLSKNQPLIPLFEAIVNSIHAIDERKKLWEDFNSYITIKIIRSNQMSFDANELAPISSFEIIDNGVGFNEENLNSFMESDSTYKAAIGGKGVGRFSWLIAFEKADIESIYWDQDSYVKRNLSFLRQVQRSTIL
jgi:hypothetical protein